MTYVDNVGVFHVQSDMERIGKYEIIGELGRGGMGVVYKARDPVIGRTVAIKVILKHLLHAADVKKRFYREARSAGQLSHDNITTIYNVDEEHGHPYLVMEYLEGQNLRQMLRDQAPLSFQQRIAIARQICRGLDYAHRNGVIHRDIKPENISVLPDGRVKIMDFGIARIQNEVQTLTQTNTSVGTPRYMSPEQIKGEPVDGRSDIFSFGVLFYELLTGQNPFAGAHVTTVIYKVLHAAPPSLDLEPGVLSSSLELIVGRCLSKEPGGRYGACAEIDRVLGALLSSQDEEVLASIPTSTGVMSSMVEPTIADEAVEMKAKPEEANDAETVTRIVVPDRKTPPLAKTLRDMLSAESPPAETLKVPVVPAREPRPPRPAETAAQDQILSTKYLLAAFSIVLAVFLVVAGYLILTNDPAPPPITTADPPTEQGSGSLPNTDPNIGNPNDAETDASPDETVEEDPDQDNTTSSDDATPSDGATSSDNTTPSDAAARQAAINARAAMDQARRRVVGRGTEAEVADLFGQAEQARRAGTSALQGKNFEGATRSFGQARGLFDQIKQALDEKDAAIATAQAQTDQARAAMLASKNEVLADLQQTPSYQRALALETEGNDAYAARDFDRATNRFDQARTHYEEAAATPTPAGAVRATIQALTRQLKTAIERENNDTLFNVFYSDWSTFFNDNDNITAVVRAENLNLTETSATIDIRVHLSFRNNRNENLQGRIAYNWILQYQESTDAWTIHRVSKIQ